MSELSIGGGCHCRALTYELRWPGADGEDEAHIPVRRCSCSFCTRIDGAWTSHPLASLVVFENAGRPATRYRFATGTADFMFCSHCGITPLVTCKIDGQVYAVVNVNTFDDTGSGFSLDFSDTSFDGESLEERLGRRQARWIPSVAFTG